MTLSDYSQLKQQVVLSVASKESHSNIIHSLKELFKDGINSVRRFEDIKTIEELLKVLELRDLLSEDNVTPLKDIAKELKNRSLLNKVIVYEENHEPRQYFNYYASEKANKSSSLGCFISHTSSDKDRRKERIIQIVTEQIGSSWKNLGRNLKIQEWRIEDIDDKHASLATKASEIMKLFLERADKHKWHFDLCEALDKTRRKQLRLAVQDIMTMNM